MRGNNSTRGRRWCHAAALDHYSLSAIFYSLSGFANLRDTETIWLYYAAQMLQALEVARQQSLGARGEAI